MSLLKWTTKRIENITTGIGRLHNEEVQYSDEIVIPTGSQDFLDPDEGGHPELNGGDLLTAQDESLQILNPDLALFLEEASAPLTDSVGVSPPDVQGAVGFNTTVPANGFFGFDRGVNFNNTSKYLNWDAYPISGPLHTISFCYYRTQVAGPTFFRIEPDTNSFIQITNDAAIAVEDDVGVNATLWTPARLETVWYAFTMDFTNGEIVCYANGLPYATLACSTSNDIILGSPAFIAFDGTTGDGEGTILYFSHSESIVTPEDIYQSWRRFSGKRRWFYTELTQRRPITTLGNSAADIEFHLPLEENSQLAFQFLDVSGNENHGSALGTTTDTDPAQLPILFNDTWACVGIDTISGGITVPTSFDVALSSFTFFIVFDSDSATVSESVFSVEDAGATGFLAHYRNAANSSEFRFEGTLGNATIAGTDVYDDSAVHRIVCRYHQPTETIDMWEDGVYLGVADTTGISMPSMSGQNFLIGSGGSSSVDVFRGRISLPTLFSDAIAGQWCLELSSGSTPDPQGRLEFEEASGTFTFDSTANGNNGTYVGTISYQQIAPPLSVVDYSISGTGYVTAPNASFGITDPSFDDFTVVIWAKQNSTVSDAGIWACTDTGNRNDLYFVNSTTDARWDFFDGTNLARITVTGVNDGNWHRFVCRFDSTAEQIDMWVDGVAQTPASTVAVTMSPSVRDWRFKSSYIASACDEVADVRVFNTALTDQECLALSRT